VAEPFVLEVGEPGEPELAQPSPDGAADYGAGAELVDDAPQVPDAVVRGILAALGSVASTVAAPDDVPDAWRFTPRELDDLTPPLARVVNARPALRRAVQRGDSMTVAVHLAGYVGRNVTTLRKAASEREPDPGDFDLEGASDLPPGMAGAF
jgi:hypothetical protein